MNTDLIQQKFGSFFKGTEWKYNEMLGVGIKLIGFPTDVNQFTSILIGYSCNPIATQRILHELETKNVKVTTLMFSLNYINIGKDLEKIGVKMEIIPPLLDQKLLNNYSLDDTALSLIQDNIELPENFTEIQKKEILQRKKNFLEMTSKYNIKNNTSCSL